MKWWLVIQLLVLKGGGLTIVLATDWNLPGWGIFFAGGFVVMAHHLLPRTQGLCDVVTGFKAKGREVWLTIDDGPDPEDTPRILDLLKNHDARATFFMIGARAEQHPAWVRRVVEAGHTVGSHTYNHPLANFWCAGPRRVERELDQSIAVLRNAGAKVLLFRSPAGIKNVFLRRCLRERGLRYIGWTLRSGDVFHKTPAPVIKAVTRKLQPGVIILMHEGPQVAPSVRVHALEGVLGVLKEKGYRCVLPEL